MTTTIKKHDKITIIQPGRAEVLKKINKSTQAMINSTILPLLKKKGAVDLSIDELRKRLSTKKKPAFKRYNSRTQEILLLLIQNNKSENNSVEASTSE